MQDTTKVKSLKSQFESAKPVDAQSLYGSAPSSSLKDQFAKAKPLYDKEAIEQEDPKYKIKDIVEAEMEQEAAGMAPMTDDLKKKRIEEIDAEIDKVSEEQKIMSQAFRGTTMAALYGPLGGYKNIRKEIEDRTNQLRALRVEQNELRDKLAPPTDQEKKEALESFGIGSYNNDSESAFKAYDLVTKLGSKKAQKAHNAGIKDRAEIYHKEGLNKKSPETILSYANLIYGEIPKLKHVSNEDVKSVLNKIVFTNEYNEAPDIDKKIKLIDKGVSEYIASLDLKTAEGAEPIDKTELKNSILANMLPKLMYSEDGGLSPEGTMLFIKHQLNEVNMLVDLHEKAMLDAGVTNLNASPSSTIRGMSGLQIGNNQQELIGEDSKLEELKNKYGKDNINAWYGNVRKEYFSLLNTKKRLERNLEYPISKRGLKDIGKVIKTADPRSLYTLFTTDYVKSKQITGIVDKLENDKPITYAEQKDLETFATLNYLKSLDTESTAFKVGTGVVNMLPYVAQFVISKGGYTVARAAMAKTMGSLGTKKLFSIAGKQITAQKLATTALGSAGHAALAPQMYLTKITDYARDNVNLIADPELGQLVADVEVGTGMPLGKAIGKGAWETYAEFYTERLGGYMKLGKGLKGKIGKLTNEQVLKNAALTGFMKSKGIATVKELSKSVSKAAGWHGIMEEYLEEVANYYMAGSIDPKSLEGPGSKAWRQQQLETFLTVAAFSPVMKAADFTTQATIGKNMHITGKYASGKEFNVKIPRKLYSEIANIFAESKGLLREQESNKIDEILTRYEGKLNKQQFDVALHMVTALGKQKQEEIIASQAVSGSILDMTVEAPLDTDQTAETTAMGKFSEEERKEIKEENDRIRTLYPDLIENNLISVDPTTGQFIEPDKNSIVVFKKQVDKQIDALAKYDDKGNITNITPELEKLIEKRDVLEQRLSEFEAVDTKNFLDMTVGEKNQILQKELGLGRELSGTADLVTDRKITVKLSDGRTVNAYLDPRLTNDEKTKVTEAIVNNKRFSLRLVKQTEWNPMLAIVDDLGVPYGDKVDVILDGKSVASVQITDFRDKAAKEKDAENKKEQAKKQFVDKLTENKPISEDDTIKREVKPGQIVESNRQEFFEFINKFLAENNIQLDKEYTYDEISKFIGIPDSEVVRQILTPIESYIKKTGAKIIFVSKIDDGAADYSSKTNNVRIPLDNMALYYAKVKSGSRKGIPWFTPQYWLSETFIHELVHSVTSQKIDIANGRFPHLKRFVSDREREIVRDINRLLDFIKLNYPEDRKLYGLTNANEFIAEAFSNQEFVAYLASIPIEDYVYEAPNAFVALIKKILELLGFKPVKNSALESVVNLATELASKYNAEVASEISDEIQLHDVLFGGKGPGEHKLDIEGFLNDLSKEDRDKLTKDLFTAIDAISDIEDIRIGDVIPMLHDAIDNTESMPDEQKLTYKAMINLNKEKIMAHVNRKYLKKQGMAKKVKPLSIDDFVFPDIEGVAFTSGQKVEMLLNGYAPIWKAIADDTGTNKDYVEKMFYKLAKTGKFQGEVHNTAQYQNFIEELRGQGVVMDRIADALKRSSLGTAVSVFEFYRSLRLTKQYGFVIKGNKGSMKLLNPPDSYEDLKAKFWERLNSYQEMGLRGFDAIEKRLRRHIDSRRVRFQIEGTSSHTKYERMAPEVRERLRREQHEEDIKLLSDITGTDLDIWRDYFSEQTRETFAHATRNADVQTNYTTYDNLLSNDVYRNDYPRIQSDLMFNLLLKVFHNKTPRESKEFFIQYFTQGDETKGVLSNLFKLSTASKSADELALSGVNILSDRFSSFVQDSMIFDIAEDIRNHHLSNELTKFYFRKGKDAEIIVINGLADTSLETKVSAEDMSFEDLWTTQLWEFLQGTDSYNAWMGQYGDKPTLYFIEAPKRAFPEKDSAEYNDLIKRFPDFDKAVDWILRQFVNYNPSFFNSFLPSTPKGLNDEQGKEFRRNARYEIARDFVYNFAMNMNDITEVFHGDFGAYSKGLVELVKRGGSANSTGYRTLATIQNGLAETYQFALVNDKIAGAELFDGVEFMSGDYAARMQISIGKMFSKEDVEGMEILSSVKGLHTTVDPETNLRGLTKGNIINIELLAKTFPGSKFDDINKFMKKNGIDRLSFGSTTKLFEKAKGKAAKEAAMIQLWDKEGNAIKTPTVPANGIITRFTKDTYIQQDLRHPTLAKSKKMSSQMLGNMRALPHGREIAEMTNALQNVVINEMLSDIANKTISKAKLDWLEENLNENNHEELQRMLDLGMTLYDPGFSNYVRKILSSHVTRKALEIPINRVTTQEIPDPEGLLKGRRLSKDGKYVLLPEIASNVDGARYAEFDFDGKPEEAIKHVQLSHAKFLKDGGIDKYADLFDLNGNLMEWEIRDNNGVIPGEMIMSTRTPADDLHSHTVGRLKFKIIGGNFTMLDKKSQLASGSDFDGDQRFNWVLYKDKKNNVIFDNSKEGIANKLLLQIAEDYTDPSMSSKIEEPINTNSYNSLVDKLRVGRTYNLLDPKSWNMVREENMTGVRMKGLMTDLNTVYSLIHDKQITFKKKISLPLSNNRSIFISGIRRDNSGLMKIHIANLLNMAFDNAADPKIELMGLNEITASMFVIALIGDKSVDTSNNDSINKHIEKVSEYFRQPIMQDFVAMMRRANGGMRKKEMKGIQEKLELQYGEGSAKDIISFYNSAKELADIRRFYSMTQKMPNSTVELQNAAQLYRKVKNNNSEKIEELKETTGLSQKEAEKLADSILPSEFRFIDTRNLFDNAGHPIIEFAIAENALALAEDFIYRDTFEYSMTGREIYAAIYAELKKKEKNRKYVSESELKAISYGLNTAAAVRAIGMKQTVRHLHKTLIDNLDSYRAKYPKNKFLEELTIARRDGGRYLEISLDRQRMKIPDATLAEIRKDFDAIFYNDPDLADMFVSYAISKWGTSTSPWRGSYFGLVGEQYRVLLSKKMQNQLYDWEVDGLPAEEKYQIMQHTLRSSRDKVMRELSETHPANASMFDYNALPTVDISLSYDALSALEHISTMEEFVEYSNDHGFDAETLVNVFNSKYPGLKLKPWAKSSTEEFKTKAARTFPSKPPIAGTIKDMMPADAIGEALASEDPELQKFIFDHLSKTYPGVRYFTDHDAFVEFVTKNNNRGLQINYEAIGHAFGNAIYINPDKAVQSLQYHEHAHIYWDALPEDHKTKTDLINLYREEFPNASLDNIEEAIITDIGRAGFDLAKVQLRGSIMDKFMMLMQRFWRAVKAVFGIKHRYDIVDSLAFAIWKNSDQIKVSTNYADAIIKNMVSFNNKAENVRFVGDTHTHFIGDKPIPGVTSVITSMQEAKFEPDVKAREVIEKFKNDYFRYTKERLSGVDLDNMAQREAELWSDMTETGSVIHAVAESVFGNRIITNEEKAQFKNLNDYYDLITAFEELKDNILAAAPDAIFYTERHLISKKYQIGGFVDLVVDVGDNKLWVYDFKTTAEEYADVDLLPLESYRKAYGLFRAPFTMLPQSKYNKHLLQLNMYANILEEQEDPNQPGIKNVVEKLMIIPILRDIKEGKIESAKMAMHHAKIPRTAETKKIADRMMFLDHATRQNFNDIYPEFKEVLKNAGIASPLIRDTLVAYDFWKHINPDLTKITRQDIESIRGVEFSAMKTKLFSLGFTEDDIYGSKAMPFEFLFFNAFAFNLTRTEFINSHDTFFTEQEVNVTFSFIPNPDAIPRRWHKVSHEGEEYIVHEEGYETLKEGDQIMMVYDIKRPTGETTRDIYFYTVIGTNKKTKSIHVRNDATGKESYLRMPTGTSGALKIHNSLPGNVPDPGPNSYVPRYNVEKISQYERHVDFGKIDPELTKVGDTEAAEYLRKRSIKTMHKVFHLLTNIAEAESFAKDSENVNNLLIELASIDNRFSGHLVSFLQGIATNHLFASSIVEENKRHPGVPTEPLPMTLNIYYFLTTSNNNLFKDWDTLRGIRMAMPQRILENHYIPLTLLTTIGQNLGGRYIEESVVLNNKLKKYSGEIDYEKATVKTSDGEVYWRRPSEKALDNEPFIREFLELIYKYHEKYDPDMIAAVANNQLPRLPISNIYMTRPEANERWGNKWGPVMYERLQPSKYDSIRLDVIDFVDGKYEKKKDPKGNYRTMTLREIKEQFAIMNLDQNEIKKYLGDRARHFMKIPGTTIIRGKDSKLSSAGLLNEYVRRAEAIYRKNGDVNNLGTMLRVNEKSIPVLGKGKTPYSTKHWVEAEAKALDSMMNRYYMKNLMGPLDYFVNMYTTVGNDPGKHITKYVQEWGEYILYGKHPEQSFLGSQSVRDLVHFGNRMNSLNKIFFSFKTQGVNLAIGQALDVIREPGAYGRGMSRVFKDPREMRKAMNLAKRFDLANIVDDAVFDQLDKEMRVAGVDIKKIEDVGYKLMEWAEKANQFPVFIGLMTDAEWNSYDNNGEVIDEMHKLTDYRKSLILSRVRDIHGDYSKLGIAPWWIHTEGQAFMQFKKWMPAYIWAQLAPYHIDKNLMVRSGILPTVKLAAKILNYNRKSVEQRQKILSDILLAQEEEGDVGPEYFKNAQEYLNTIINETNGARISFKTDLSKSDMANLRSALNFTLFGALYSLAVMMLVKGSDDPDEYKSFAVRMFLPLLKRFNGDVFWIYSAENWQYFTENLIPSMSLIIDGLKFAVDFKEWVSGDGVYKKDTLTANKGFPKWIIDATYFIPAGSFMRWANQKARIRVWKNQRVNLYELGLDQSDIEAMGLDSGFISKFDLKENAFKYGKVYETIRLAREYDALVNKGIDPDEYYDLYFGERLLKQERNQLNDALNMYKIEEMFNQGQFGEWDDLLKKARAMREYKKEHETQRDKKTRKEINQYLKENR